MLVFGSSAVRKKNNITKLKGLDFEPLYLPFENLSKVEVNHNNTKINIILVPVQMPYLTNKCVNSLNFDCVLLFVDVTSRLSNKKVLQWRRRIQDLCIPVHLVYNKNDVVYYNNKLDEITQNLKCSNYSVISERTDENTYVHLIWICESF